MVAKPEIGNMADTVSVGRNLGMIAATVRNGLTLHELDRGAPAIHYAPG
jgi:hypothetical protein